MSERERHHVQQDFSGGEIGGRMIMRDDTELYGKSLLEMLNFMPTLQGTATRTPGTRFLQEIEDVDNARILPYTTPNGQRALVVLTPAEDEVTLGDLHILQDVTGDANSPTTSENYVSIKDNGNIDQGSTDWVLDPPTLISSDGAELGWVVSQNWLNLVMRTGNRARSGDPASGSISGVFTIPEATDHVLISPDLWYNSNAGTDWGITVTIKVGTTEGGGELYNNVIPTLTLGGPHYLETIVVPSITWVNDTTLYYITVEVETPNTNDASALPEFVIAKLDVFSLVTGDAPVGVLTGVVPYLSNELNDVHFVQSPYTDDDPLNIGVAKELVMTHSAHPPMKLWYDTQSGPAYVFDEMYTQDADTDPDPEIDNGQHYLQWGWDIKGYPATCTSYLGRLILAGSTDRNTDALILNGTNSETVWGSKVGEWGYFTDPDVIANDGAVPADSISFTAIYRSAINWVQGQKELLVGAGEMEYTASGEGIFQPSDLGVFMQSTHGSNRVQPVAMGPYVLFPAGGNRVRAMQFAAADDGWTAPDQTLAHPSLLSSGIKRMVRMRNPHQMCVVVMGNGQLALFHIDTNAGIKGWSRLSLTDNVIDVAVLSDEDGVDILFMLVKRNIGGVSKIYLEAIPDWTVSRGWSFLQSSISAVTTGVDNVVTGLDHLEGRYVQVVADSSFLGTYQVGVPAGEAAGTITLVNQIGEAINYTSVVVGLPMSCSMKTLPLVTQDPGSKKRYTSITVRTVGSARPVINGERPADRDPITSIGLSQRLDIVKDNQVAAMGSDESQVITVSETLPLRVEVLGIFGKLKESSL